MNVVRWNPWGDLYSLHDQMDRLFGEAVGTLRPLPGDGRQAYANLALDIRQTGEAYLIDASIPGLRPEDVEITFDGGVLTIKGEARSEQETKQGEYVRRERRETSVLRQVSLPAEVRAEEITASFENGVLTVTVPRAQKAQPKRIPVSAASGGQPRVVEGAAEQPKS